MILMKKETIKILKTEQPCSNTIIFGVKKIGLSGSHSKETQREDRDANIIVELKPLCLKFVELSDYIENLMGKK